MLTVGDRISIQLLGPVHASVDGVVAELGGPRQRRLLAVLAMHAGEPVGTSGIIDAVWPEGDLPSDPRETLRTYVSRLRRALGGSDTIAARAGTYTLRVAPDTIDAHRFEACLDDAREEPSAVRLREAISLWRGPALDGFEHEDWARSYVVRLTELCLVAGDELGRVLIEEGSVAEAVTHLTGVVADHPLRERSHRLLMLALHRSGRSAEALRVFQDYRRRMATDLGLDPSDEITALERTILGGGSPIVPTAPGDARGYRLIEKIGEGAYAVVFRGIQPAVNREVAIKVIRKELADRPPFIRRFEAEAHLVARLEHPRIVPLYDYWRQPGSAWLVMRHLRGGTLAARLAAGPLPAHDTGVVVSQIAEALAAAHRMGVIHRDVKPANIFFDDDTNAFLGDFGIAFDQHDTDIGRAGPSIGSPAYAAPEQLLRQDAIAAIDEYGLAVTAFECLTGRHPFGDAGSDEQLRHRQLHARLPTVRTWRLELTADVDRVLARATDRVPADRYPSITEFAAELAVALSDRAADTRPVVEAPVPRNPYKGLLAFQEADAPDFFGRGRLVARLLERLAQEGDAGRFVVLIGPSGAGKSSVVRAGVLPAVRAGAVPGSDSWFVTTMVPGVHPYDELASALDRVAGGSIGDLSKVLQRDREGITRGVSRALPDPAGDLLVVIDQFEELFTRTDESERNRFIDALVRAVSTPGSRLRVLITMRADFYDHPLRSPPLAELFERGSIALSPLAPDELELAIVEPAAHAGVSFEPGLVTRIVADFIDQPGALPLLQYALTELFEVHEAGVLTTQAYEELGGLTGALARRAEVLYDDAPPAQRAAARRLFTRLTTPGEGVEDTRRRVLRTELEAGPAIDSVIEAYGSARLLAFDHDPPTRTPTVDIAHEALLRAWPRLRQWLEEDREGLRIHRHITSSAAAWASSDRDPGELYRGGRLETAEVWAEDHRSDLNPLETAFIHASREADRRRQAGDARSRRRLRRLLVGVAAVALVALVAGTLAFQQRTRAQSKASQAETERLAATAATLAVTNQRAAILMAAEAYRRDPGPKTLGAIQRVLVGATGLQRFVGPPEPVDAVAWLDAHRFAAARTGSLTIFSDTGATLASFAGVSATRLQYDPASEVLVVGTAQGVRLIDSRTGVMQEPVIAEQVVQALALGPDGVVLAGTKAGWLVGIDPVTGTERFRLMAHPERTVGELGIPGVGTAIVPHLPSSAVRGVAAIAFDPASHTLATAGFGYARFWDVGSGATAPIESVALTWTLAANQLAGGPTAAAFTDRGSALLVADPFYEWRIERSSGAVTSGSPVRERLSFVTQGDWTAPSLIDRGRLLTAFTGGFVTVSDFVGGTLERQLQHGVGEPTSMSVAADGDRILVSGSEGVVILSLRGDGPISRSIAGVPIGDSGISVDGDLVATNLVQDYRSELWRVTDEGAELVDLHGLSPFFIWFSPFEHLAAAIDLQHGLFLFDPTTGGDQRKVDGWDATRGGNPWWSPDGATVAVESESGRVSIVDAATGTAKDLEAWDPYQPPALPALAFGPDGHQLYGLHVDGTFVRWELATGQKTELANLGSFGEFGGWMAISPQGELATAYSSGEVVVRDLQTLQPTGVRYDATRPGYPGVAYSSDGTRLVTFYGREMRIWDVERHEPIGDPLPSDENSLINSTGSAFGLTSVGGTAHRWNLDDRQWPAIACAAAGRNMTRREWELYGPRDTPYQATCPDYPLEPQEAKPDD